MYGFFIYPVFIDFWKIYAIFSNKMKGLKEIFLYLLFPILVVSGVFLFMFLVPLEIVNTILGILLGIGVFVGFCFILFLLNRFIKYSTVKGGYSFDDYLNGRY